MNEVREVAGGVLATVLRSDPWEDIGFPRRPRYGAFVQRFRPEWKVVLEKTVLKEMIIVLTAAHVVAGVLGPLEVPQVVSVYIDGAGPPQGIWRALGYSSRAEAEMHLASSISVYSAAAPTDWPTLLGERLEVESVPDRRLAARLLVGVVRFAQTAEEMVRRLRSGAG